MQAVVETEGLVRTFGDKAAVAGIDLVIERGSIFGFLGPNGAGKTTTIRLLLGLLRPTRGRIRVLGHAIPAARRAAARDLGALVETPAHYDHLTGAENLDISRRLLGLPSSEVDRVLDLVDLRGAAKLRVRGYSLGMRQRLGIARVLLGAPKLLILDEPTNGLDPDGIRDVRTLIRALPEREGCTILLSSHLLAEVEQTATHVGLMWQGRLLAQGSLEETLSSHFGALELGVDRPEASAKLLEGRGLRVDRPSPDRIEVHGEADPGALNALLVKAGIRVSHLAWRKPSLEDLYVDLTRGRAAVPSAPLACQGSAR